VEANIKNRGFKPFLAIFGNSWVIVIDHKVNKWSYEGKQQDGWCYWKAGHYCFDHLWVECKFIERKIKKTFFQQILVIFGHKLVNTVANRVAVWGNDSRVAP
jgi:hypothetical protein